MTLAEYLKMPGNSQAVLAKKMGVTQGAVSQWVTSGKVPSDRWRGVVGATSGAVTPHDLAPDLFPAGFRFIEHKVLDPREQSAA